MLSSHKAPNFRLADPNGEPFELRQLAGHKNVVLVFYPFDWSPVCSDQIALYNAMHGLFEKREAAVIGISTDSFYCHAAFSGQKKLRFPLLADFEPKGSVAHAYGVYNEQAGRCKRALFVLDKDQAIIWRYLAADTEQPGADGIFAALDKLIDQNQST